MSPGKQDIEIFGNRTTTIETGNDNPDPQGGQQNDDCDGR
jgi:hypothetical protein